MSVHIKNGRIFILVKAVKKEESYCKKCCFFGSDTGCKTKFPMCYLGHYFIEVSKNGI